MSYYAITPTRTLRGALCAALGRFAGLAVWIGITLLGSAIYAFVWCWAQICDRLGMPFDESRSVTWCLLMLVGAVVGFITMADLWPAVEHLWSRFAAAWSRA